MDLVKIPPKSWFALAVMRSKSCRIRVDTLGGQDILADQPDRYQRGQGGLWRHQQ